LSAPKVSLLVCSFGCLLQRVMPTLLFILLRFYLRVDGVLVRTNDTRYFHEAGTDYMLREFCSKESRVTDLRVREEGLNLELSLVCSSLLPLGGLFCLGPVS